MYSIKSPLISLNDLNLFSLSKTPKFHRNHISFRRNPNFKIRPSSSIKEIGKSSPDLKPPDAIELKLDPQVSAPFPSIRVAKRVVLVRHGQSTWNEEGRIQGSSDFSRLTQKGESQAETSRLMLIDDSFDICFSSPLTRSKRTAEIIWGTRDEEIVTDSDLREIDLYSFQGLLKHEGQAKFGAQFRKWQIDAPNFEIDGHYPVRELWARARNCWDKILAHEGRSVLVVAHNAVNQALVATALGLGTEYFRILLQSNCGVSVLDFTPQPDGGSPYICLNRLNQTPGSPVGGGSSAGRIASNRIILVCQGSSDGDSKASIASEDSPMNMLGVVQSQKIAELLLDLKVNKIISSPRKASVEMAEIIARVQEAADCLGADCVPRYVETKQMHHLNFVNILQKSETEFEDEVVWDESSKAWKLLLEELSSESDTGTLIVAIADPTAQIGLIGYCLNLTKKWLRSFHLDDGSISIVDFPDGPTGRGVVRCINYTAHLGRWSIPITRSALNDEEF